MLTPGGAASALPKWKHALPNDLAQRILRLPTVGASELTFLWPNELFLRPFA